MSHVEKNVFILKHVLLDILTANYDAKKSFLDFVNCNKKTGEVIAILITSKLQNHKISLKDYRGQG